MDSDEENRKLYCANLTLEVDEEILHELFLQAGPLEKIIVPKDPQGNNRGFAFIVFKHECSVSYAIELFRDTSLFGRLLQLRARRNNVNNAYHQRSYSEPANPNNHPSNAPAHVDFDSLLAMCQNMYRGDQSVSSGPIALPPTQSGPFLYPPQPWSHSQSPLPNAQFGPNNQESIYSPYSGEESASFERGSLSRSSLQGNWSARNDSNMMPHDYNQRSDQRRRSDREYRGRTDFDRNDFRSQERNERRRNDYCDRNKDHHDGYDRNRHKDKSHRNYDSDRSERNEFRRHSSDSRDRRRRY